MSYELKTELNFPESDEDALDNMVMAQALLFTLLTPLLEDAYENNADARTILRLARGLSEAAEQYVVRKRA